VDLREGSAFGQAEVAHRSLDDHHLLGFGDAASCCGSEKRLSMVVEEHTRSRESREKLAASETADDNARILSGSVLSFVHSSRLVGLRIVHGGSAVARNARLSQPEARLYSPDSPLRVRAFAHTDGRLTPSG
jgi:hypothetical protein